MSFDTPGRGRRDHSRAPRRRAAVGLAATISFVLLATCSPATDSSDEATEAPPPRITAEHPVTARPALEAGLLDGGTTDGGPVLGEAGSLDGPEAGAVGAALAAVLPADDVARSIDFYTGLLGFDVTSSEPPEPPFRRVELTRGDIRIVLLGPEAWEREMSSFGAPPAAGAEPEAEETGGEEGEAAAADGVDPEPAETAGDAGGPGPVLRLALEDLDAVAVGLAEAGVEVEVGDGEAGGAEVPDGRLAVVDPAGVRLLLVPAEGS